jgi:hypothetical protein
MAARLIPLPLVSQDQRRDTDIRNLHFSREDASPSLATQNRTADGGHRDAPKYRVNSRSGRRSRGREVRSLDN